MISQDQSTTSTSISAVTSNIPTADKQDFYNVGPPAENNCITILSGTKNGTPANVGKLFSYRNKQIQFKTLVNSDFNAETIACNSLTELQAVIAGLDHTQCLLLSHMTGTAPGEGYSIYSEFNLRKHLNATTGKRPAGLRQYNGELIGGRFKENFVPSRFVMFDRDKDDAMPVGLQDDTDEDWWNRMRGTFPVLDGAAHLVIPSSKSRVVFKDGSHAIDNSSSHTYIMIEDAADWKRFTEAMKQTGLNGDLGYLKPSVVDMAGGGTQVRELRRTIFDPAVFRTQQPIFEGAPAVTGRSLFVSEPASSRLPGAYVNSASLASVDAVEAGGEGSSANHEDGLLMEMMIETERKGTITVAECKQILQNGEGKLRCQTPYRKESRSMNGIMRLTHEGEICLHDNGLGITFHVDNLTSALAGLAALAPKAEVVDINAGHQPEGSPEAEEKSNRKRSNVSAIDKLRTLSATNRIEEMKKNLQSTEYIFPGMALTGQISLFYGWPGSAKTLLFFKLLTDAIDEGRLAAEDLIYINADDHYVGLVEKAVIAGRFGFEMISPAEANINPSDVLALLKAVAEEGDMTGKVVVMDTLKKFADMMSKDSQATLFNTLRVMIAKGGTVIIAGHANKHKDAEGNLVYEGTSDTKNDIDCMYAIYQTSEKGAEAQTIELRNEKDRGRVEQKVAYQYTKRAEDNYLTMMHSVEPMDKRAAKEAAEESRRQHMLHKFNEVRTFVTKLLESKGKMNQSEILKAWKENPAGEGQGLISRNQLKDGLKELTDVCWQAIRQADNNVIMYAISERIMAGRVFAFETAK